MSKHWYILQVVSGYENKVKLLLEKRIQTSDEIDKFGDIVVPTESFVEMRSGKKYEAERSFFPGYVLINMEVNESTWRLINSTNRVIGFLGGKSGQPVPLKQSEIDNIMGQMEDGAARPKPKVIYDTGEKIRILDGPFEEFDGIVEEVSYEKNQLRVSVSIFGRPTSVYLDFAQIQKEE